MVGFELDRLTPFSQDEADWTCRATRGAEGYRVTVFVAPRHVTGPILAELRDRRVEPAGFLLRRASGSEEVLVLPDRGARQAELPSAALVLACALAVAILPLPRLSETAEQAAESLSAVTLRAPSQPVAPASGDALGIDDSETLPDPLAVMARLTELLGDDIVVDDVAIERTRITLSGRAVKVAALLGQLSSDPRIVRPRLTSPITRDPETGRERFGLAFELASTFLE